MVRVDDCQTDRVAAAKDHWSAAVDGQMWTEHLTSLTSFFQRQIQDRHEAEDLAQTTVLIACGSEFDSARSHYGCPREQLSAWLYGIGRNVLKAHWSAQQRQVRNLRLAQQLAMIEHREQSSLQPLFDAADIREAIEQELLRCNDKEQDTVRQWLSGATYAQMHASEPSVRIGALHKRVSRFISRLKSRLQEIQDSSSETEVLYESRATPGVLRPRLTRHTKEDHNVSGV